MFRSLSLLVLLFAFCTTTASAQRYRGSGDLVKQERSARNFDGISVSSAIRLNVQQGNDYSVVIEADDNIIDRVTSDVNGGRLVLGLRNGNFNNVTINVSVTMPDLNELHGSGAARIEVDGFDEPKMELKFSGASHVHFRDSSVKNLKLRASGASSLDLDDLRTEEADIEIAGASSVSLNVRDRIVGGVSGASSVRNKGGAASDVQTSGASRYRSN